MTLFVCLHYSERGFTFPVTPLNPKIIFQGKLFKPRSLAEFINWNSSLAGLEASNGENSWSQDPCQVAEFCKNREPPGQKSSGYFLYILAVSAAAVHSGPVELINSLVAPLGNDIYEGGKTLTPN